MDKIIRIAIALLSGALLPIQAGLNTRLGKTLESALYAAPLSFLPGKVGLLIYIFVTRQTVSFSGVKEAPSYIWTRGLMGAFYFTVSILVFPELGPGLTFGLIITGQMLVSLTLEHFTILVPQSTPVSYMKITGVLPVLLLFADIKQRS